MTRRPGGGACGRTLAPGWDRRVGRLAPQELVHLVDERRLAGLAAVERAIVQREEMMVGGIFSDQPPEKVPIPVPSGASAIPSPGAGGGIFTALPALAAGAAGAVASVEAIA